MSELVSTAEANVSWINASGMNSDRVAPHVDKVARELANWVSSTRRASTPSIFNRAAYVAPDNPYASMATARKAVENDDVVGGVADVTEGLIFQGLKWESSSADDSDVFNQMSADLNLDEFARQWHREEFTYSQAVCGIWWGRKSYTVRGKGDKAKRKKKYDIICPVALTFLDPARVVPLQPGPFGQDTLAWHATREEFASAQLSIDGSYSDPVLAAFTNGPVRCSAVDRIELSRIGVDPDRLLALNPATVFRFTRTRLSYERFTVPRLKSVFALLDLKQQLMESDRVSLVGSANFILLVKQGSPEEPAMPAELDNLKENFKMVAKLPVVIGDHRLNIEIITPSQEYVLTPEKYDTIDRRIMSRALGSLSVASSGQRNESTVTIARGVGRLLENQRHMMKRTLEREIARAIVNHPGNIGKFDGEPNLVFSPRNVQLDNDAAAVTAIMGLRTQNELSRESTLEYFGFDQTVEALRREFEEESGLDDIFKTVVPFSSPAQGGPNAPDQPPAEPPAVSGARGGRPTGGGKSKASPQGRSGGRTAKGNPTTGDKR